MEQKLRQFYNNYKTEIFFVTFCFCFYLAWALFIPYGQGPDEDMRYDVAHFIYKYNRLPFGDEPEIVNPIWGISYAHTPIFAYQISAVFMEIAALFGTPEGSLFLAARVANVCIATGTAVFVILISHKCFVGINRFVFATLVCFLPQFVFISSYVNNDTLAMFSTAIIFYAWILGLEKHWNLKSVLLLSVGLSFCFLSYYNAYGFILCSVILYVGDYLINRKEWSFQKFIKFGLLIVAICAVLAGWWFIRNGIIHDGDIIGMKTSAELAEKLAKPKYKPSLHVTPQGSGYSVLGMIFGSFQDTQWIFQTGMSFIGCFGSVNIPMGIKAYILIGSVFGIGSIGFIVEFCKETRKKINKRGYLWCSVLILAMIIPVILSIYYSYTSDYQPQGRYVMPLLIPLIYCLTRGIGWIEKWLTRKNIKYPLGLGIIFVNSLIAVYSFCIVMGRAYLLFP
ncbi:MAG: DUF2142 domain-containing protein [Eubacterium sp.]